MTKADDEQPIRLVSELQTARERFLSRVVDHVLQDGWRTADDFLRHFPPSAIIESLAGADTLRAKLLVSSTGVIEKIAVKKSIASASEDLALALEEGATDADTLLAMYPPDDRVRYLDENKLWHFVIEDEFWTATPNYDKAAHAKASARMTFMIECALSEQLLTLREVADGMTFQEIATSLPVNELQEVVKHALQIARADAPLTEERLLAVVPLASLVEHVRLEHTWKHVLYNKVAVECGWADALPPSSGPKTDENARGWSSAPPPPAHPVPAPPSAPPPPRSPKSESLPPPPSTPAEAKSDRPPEEDDARRRVIDRLQQIDRLPPKIDALSTPILLSMESMYADLADLTDDDDREACIRESFPNEGHLRQAMLALIDLLDPSVNTEDPVIRDADVEGLIKLVLFEERRRSDPSRRSQASIVATTPGRRQRNRSLPPPLPRSSASSAPPPLPEESPARSKRAT